MRRVGFGATAWSRRILRSAQAPEDVVAELIAAVRLDQAHVDRRVVVSGPARCAEDALEEEIRRRRADLRNTKRRTP